MSIHVRAPRITLSEPSDFLSWPRILREVAGDFGVEVDDLRAPGRRQPAARARQYAYTRMHDETPLPMDCIADIFDRDRTSIIFGINATRARLKKGETQ